MIFGLSRRTFRSRLFRTAVLIIFIWTFVEAFYIHRNLVRPDQIVSNGYVNTEKIFVTGLAWNSAILFRTHLIEQIKDLVRLLGVENVYISIYENGSYDDTKGALRELQLLLEEMGVRNTITVNETSHEDIVRSRPTEPTTGWLKITQTGFESSGIQKGDYALRRIQYLAELRNRALEPLWELAEKGEKYDKILFLSDVVFTSDDAIRLLDTRNGQYAAACAMDFESPPVVYDTFALRDDEGHEPLMQRWPLFRSEASRKAVLGNQPIPVQSCWNGMLSTDI